MKNHLLLSSFISWALALIFSFPLLAAHDSKALAAESFREKAKGELEALKKDSQKVGQEVHHSAKELPSHSREEFKKTGRALEKTGKELKESTKEAVQSLKELLKK